ncbi:alpha-galactosidase, partial [Sphaerisporangium dianthi]
MNSKRIRAILAPAATAALVLASSVAAVTAAAPAQALENGVARTPPMGWNSWNTFGCNISESLIKQMADAIVNSGLRD